MVVPAAWNPWHALRDDDGVHFRLVDGLPKSTGGGLYCPASDGSADVLIDRGVDRVARAAILAHELGHRAGIPESMIDDWVARRLVPYAELAAMREIAVLNELPVERWQIAEKFDVPDAVAERAMRLLLKGDRW